MTVNVSEVAVRAPSGVRKSSATTLARSLFILIVNMASQCGFTRQYTGLQSL